MNIDLLDAIGYCWIATGIIWLFGMLSNKAPVRAQTTGSRLFHVSLALLGGFFIGGSFRHDAWMSARFVPHTHSVELAGLVLTAAGMPLRGLGADDPGQQLERQGYSQSRTRAYREGPLQTGASSDLYGIPDGSDRNGPRLRPMALHHRIRPRFAGSPGEDGPGRESDDANVSRRIMRNIAGGSRLSSPACFRIGPCRRNRNRIYGAKVHQPRRLNEWSAI